MVKCYAVTGGAGFIGSHFVDELLSRGHKVVALDNLCSGSLAYISHNIDNPSFEFQMLDIEDTEKLSLHLRGVDTVIHLASNPDIAKAVNEPRIDFTQGTVLTESVAEAARISGVNTILYASGSGVYGDAGEEVLNEKSPLNPISTYGASKLAGESILSAYSYMFGISARVFRFANVVGCRQTHGVGFDFIKKLKLNSSELFILGNGLQSKSYVHVSDVIRAVLAAELACKSSYEVFNISTDDKISVNQIADFAIEIFGLNVKDVSKRYSGGDRGWKADVPIVRLSSNKIRELGWVPLHSGESALKDSLACMLASFNE